MRPPKNSRRNSEYISKCFLSYAYENADRISVQAFKYILARDHGDDGIIFDDQVLVGESITQFIKQIESSDAAIILMTPEYKNRVRNRTGVVKEEYDRILERYDASCEKREKGLKPFEIKGYFQIIPILWSGDHETSVPSEISERTLKYLDFREFRVS